MKGNQETLHQAVIDHIDEQLEEDLAGGQEHVTTEKGHGRQETRTYLQMAAPEGLPGFGVVEGLKSIGVVTSQLRPRRQGDRRGPLLHQQPGGGREAVRAAVRGHWGIENSCHWSPRRDLSRGRVADPRGTLRENFAWLNRFTLSLLKQHPGRKSLAMKRRSCGWSDDFLMQVITGSTA